MPLWLQKSYKGHLIDRVTHVFPNRSSIKLQTTLFIFTHPIHLPLTVYSYDVFSNYPISELNWNYQVFCFLETGVLYIDCCWGLFNLIHQLYIHYHSLYNQVRCRVFHETYQLEFAVDNRLGDVLWKRNWVFATNSDFL